MIFKYHVLATAQVRQKNLKRYLLNINNENNPQNHYNQTLNPKRAFISNFFSVKRRLTLFSSLISFEGVLDQTNRLLVFKRVDLLFFGTFSFFQFLDLAPFFSL